jgi:thiamine pyrophosphokinase
MQLAQFLADCTLILAHGRAPSKKLLRECLKKAKHFIALDGAADWALLAGFLPDLIIGDLDSISSFNSHKVPMLKIDEQESNDLEKSLRYCLAQGKENVLVLGAFGHRLDHILTNIYVLKKYYQSLNIIFIDDKEIAFICPKNKHYEIHNKKDTYISLYPMNEHTGPITTKGLLYSLDNEFLSINYRLGTLNKIISNHASILNQNGDLLLIMAFTGLSS